MAKTSSGVYQLLNGMWGFRYAFMLDGKQKDIRLVYQKALLSRPRNRFNAKPPSRSTLKTSVEHWKILML